MEMAWLCEQNQNSLINLINRKQTSDRNLEMQDLQNFL